MYIAVAKRFQSGRLSTKRNFALLFQLVALGLSFYIYHARMQLAFRMSDPRPAMRDGVAFRLSHMQTSAHMGRKYTWGLSSSDAELNALRKRARELAQTQSNKVPEVRTPPARPRVTWGPDSQDRTTGQQHTKPRPIRASEPNPSTTGGYLEIHKRKQANAVGKEQLTHVSAPDRQRKQLDGESKVLRSAPAMGRNTTLSDTGGYQPSFGSNDVAGRKIRAGPGNPAKSQNDAFSSSCPTTFFNQNNQVRRLNKSPRRPPLSSGANEPAGQNLPSGEADESESPIPLKPQLARLSAKQREGARGSEQRKLVSGQSPLKMKDSASPRMDRIADNPTVENVRPLMKQKRAHHQTSDAELVAGNGGDLGVLDPPGYTPSGFQQNPNLGMSGVVPMPKIRHPSHQMKASSTSNGYVFLSRDADSNPLFKQTGPILKRHTFDHYSVDYSDGASSQPNAGSRADAHGVLRSAKSFPSDAYPTNLVTHPRLLQNTASLVKNDAPRTAPNAGMRTDDAPYKSSMDLIRHSAQKKRNQMQRSLSSGKDLVALSGLDGSLSSVISGPSSGRATAPESGSYSSSEVFSPIGNKRSSRTNSDLSSTDTGYISTLQDSRKLRKSQVDADYSPFMTKPSIARPGSGRPNVNGHSAIGATKDDSTAEAPTFKYSPNSGVSFSSKKTKSNVSVVGYGYGPRSPSTSEPSTIQSRSFGSSTSETTLLSFSSSSSKPSPTNLGQNSKEKRKNQKGSSVDLPAAALDFQENFNVKGQAIRDASLTNLAEPPSYYLPSAGSKDEAPSRSSSRSNDSPPSSSHPLDVVYGKAVRHSSSSSEILNEEGRESVPLSASLLAHQLRKKDDLELFKTEKKTQSKSQGSEQHPALDKRFSGLDIDSRPPIDDFNATGPLLPSKSNSSKKSRTSNSKVSPPRAVSLDRKSGSRDSAILRTTNVVLPCSDPESLLNEAVTGLHNKAHSEEWEAICNHIHSFRRLASHHPDVLATRIKEVLFELNDNVGNLRSQVSRAAVVCLTDVYAHLKKPAIDTDVEATTRALLTGYGRNTGAFMQEEITRTFHSVIANVTSVKILNALLTAGSGNRNASVRNLTAQFTELIVEKMGPDKALSGVKDVTDRIMPAASAFIIDPSPAVRYHGRCLLHRLMTHPDFDKTVERQLSQKQALEMKEAVRNVKSRGVGTLGSAGARSQGSGMRRNGSTKAFGRTSKSASLERLPPSPSKSSSRRETPTKPTFNEADQEEIRALCSTLTKGDTNARTKAVSDLKHKLETNRPIIEDNIVKIMDGLRALLTTANSKVNYLGLEATIDFIRALGHLLPPSDLVANVCRLLVSKQQSTAHLAMRAVDEIMEHIDHTQLLQQFAICATYSSGKTRQVCIVKLAELVNTVSARRPQSVERHVLPVLLSLLSEKHSANLKLETAMLAKAVHATMGDALLQYAEAKSIKSKMAAMIGTVNGR